MGKWIRRLLLLLLLLVAAGFFGVPYLLQTGWAKDKVKAALAENTGRDVELGSISFSWFSGLKVSDVTVKQRPADHQGDGPLFRLDALSLKVGLGDILDKKINVEEFTVSGPRIVIVRDKSGRFNFSDLVEKPARSGAPTPGGPPAKVVARLDIRDGTILYIDEVLGTRVEAKGLAAEGTWNDGRLALSMQCNLNGGDVRLRATSDLSRNPAPFEVEEFTIDGAKFDGNLAQLGLFLPLAGDSPRQASGTLGFSLKDLRGTGFTLDALKRTLTARGAVSLKGGMLVSGPVTELYSALAGIGAGDLSALGAAGGAKQLGVELLTSTFVVKDGRVETNDMKLEGVGMNLSLSGWTSLDGTMDYRLVADGIGKLLEQNDKLKQLLGGQTTLPLSMKGALSAPRISVDLGDALKNAAENAIRGEIDKAVGDKLPGGIKIPFPGGK